MSSRLVVLASGGGTNLQAVLDACTTGRLDAAVVAVVSDRRGAGARQRAAAAGVEEVHHPVRPFQTPDGRTDRRAYDRALADLVGRFEPDWVVLAGWMRILSTDFLNRFPGRVVNLHPALPGEFAGAHAIDDAWRAHCRSGLARTGVMVHLVPDERVDAGPVLGVREVEILDTDTRRSLEARIHEVEHELLVEVLGQLTVRTDGNPSRLTRLAER